MNTNHGSGRTTKQIQDAAHNALFLCINMQDAERVEYMAARMQRQDIRVESIGWFLDGRARGQEWSEIIVDHAVWELCCDKTVALYEMLTLVRTAK